MNQVQQYYRLKPGAGAHYRKRWGTDPKTGKPIVLERIRLTPADDPILLTDSELKHFGFKFTPVLGMTTDSHPPDPSEAVVAAAPVEDQSVQEFADELSQKSHRELVAMANERGLENVNGNTRKDLVIQALVDDEFSEEGDEEEGEDEE